MFSKSCKYSKLYCLFSILDFILESFDDNDNIKSSFEVEFSWFISFIDFSWCSSFTNSLKFFDSNFISFSLEINGVDDLLFIFLWCFGRCFGFVVISFFS